jgi:hypothetical protein
VSGNLLDYAGAYASFGFRPLALAGGTKEAIWSGWQKIAPTTASAARQMFGTHGGNIGVTFNDETFTLDLDRKNGKDGIAAMELIAAPFGGLPGTLTQRTPSGSEHRVFRKPSHIKLKNGTDVLAPGIDVKTVGGYIACEPSVYEGAPYQWVDWDVLAGEVPAIADAPPWLLEKLATPVLSEPRAIETADGPKVIEGGRNDTLFKAACAMRRHGLDDDAIYAALSIRNAKDCAPPLPDKDVRTIAKSATRYTPEDTPTAKPTATHTAYSGDMGALFADVVLRKEDVEKMAEAEFLIPNMIVRGHVGAYVSPGNGGKTTIFVYLCEKLVAMGVQVLYINVDGSPGDLKRHHEHASQYGYQVIAPDARDGKSTIDVLEKMKAIASGDFRCDNYLFIFDTLKKFVDVIDKRQAKDLYKLMRSLTVKGATICLLGHCNKYKDENGQSVYEGTADLRNDLDELIYLDSYKDETQNVLQVTTRPDKVRAEFAPKSFEIDLNNDRKVTEPGMIFNVLGKDERELLDLVKAAIQAGSHSQKDIIDNVKGKTTAGEKKIRGVLLRHTQGHCPELNVTATGRGKDLHYTVPDPFACMVGDDDEDF